MFLTLIATLALLLVAYGAPLILLYPKRKQGSIGTFFLIQLIYFCWVFSSLLMLALPDPQQKALFVYARFIFIPFSLPLYVTLTLRIFQPGLYQRYKKFLIPIFIFPAFISMTALLSAMQIPLPWIQSFIHNFEPVVIWNDVTTLSFKTGKLFQIYMLQSFAMFACMYTISIHAWLRGQKQFRKSGFIFTFSGVIYIAIDLLAIRFPEFRWTQLTVIASVQILFTTYWISTRHDMFKLKELAKDKILQELPMPTLVISPQNELWDFNRRAQQVLNLSSFHLGKPITELESQIGFRLSPGEFDFNEKIFLVQEYIQSIELDLEPARIYTFTDITEIRSLFRNITRTSDFNRQLLSLLSHDLSGSLQGVNLLLQGVLGQPEVESSKNLKNQLEMTLQSQQASVDLLADLLMWTTQHEHSPSFHEPRTFSQSIQRVMEQLRPQSASRKISIEFQSDSLSHEKTTDFRLFEAALRNVVSNAIRYSDEESNVVIRLEQNDLSVRIHVEDQGRGFHSSTSEMKGFGIGLLFTRGYIKALGGLLKIESQENRGTQVTFEFPITQEEPV